jgi:hypothetical protein
MKNSKRILSVVVKHVADYDPDTSYLGEYASKPEGDYSIDRRHEQDCNLNSDVSVIREQLERILCHVESYWNEGLDYYEDGEEEARDCVQELIDALDECNCGGVGIDSRSCEYFNTSGNYKGLAYDEIKQYTWQDYERMEALESQQWYYLGIVAEAEIQATVDGKPYTNTLTSSCWSFESDMSHSDFESAEEDQLSELRGQLKDYGFSTRAIATAFKNIEHKEE